MINASPMLGDVDIDLSAGVVAALGVTHRITDWSVMENVITGAGDDRIEGNAAPNLLRAGSGDDLLSGGAGSDTLDGEAGRDTVRYAGLRAEYAVSWNPDLRGLTVVDNLRANGDDGTDLLRGIERIVFQDGEMRLDATVGNQAPVANASLFSQTVVVGVGMGILFDLPSDAFTDPDAPRGDSLEIAARSQDGGELPTWLTYDADAGTFSGVPPENLQTRIGILITATDDFGATASDVLVFQLGDNQAPVLTAPFERVVAEDAGLVALTLGQPVDPEGTAVTVEILEVPGFGAVVGKSGLPLVVGQKLSADELAELHYRTAADAGGNAGDLRYRALDDDGVSSTSSVHLFVTPVNDAPRFPTGGSALVIEYPKYSKVALDVLMPSDPESQITSVRVMTVPAVGQVTLSGDPVSVGRMLTLEQLQQLSFELSENVNGPVGALTIRAVDPQGLATDWSLEISVSGNSGSGLGTAGGDAMYGSIGNDTLSGLSGDDTMVGNAGNDRLLGGIGNDLLFGGTGNDLLDGSTGNDLLEGGAGNDTMAGGPGNDSYFVDSPGDVVLEVISGGAGGRDTIQTSMSLIARANVENLSAMPGHAIDLDGNALDNVLIGNEQDNSLSGLIGRDTLFGGEGDDTLDGGPGVDRLAGGPGDDVYIVDSRSDLLAEFVGEGHDRVVAKSTYTLPSNIEDLLLEEGGDWSAGGNSLPNHLRGNSGNNLLSGGLGADTLEGGLGDDVYVLSDTLDRIIDAGGIDVIRSVLDILLPAGIENGELVGIADTAAIGNGLGNVLTGNAGDNLLDGGAGVDTLIGAGGADQFMVASNGAGQDADLIGDFAAAQDLLLIDSGSFGLFSSNLILSSSGTVSQDSVVKGAGAVAFDQNDHWLLDTARNLLRFDADGSGPLAPITLVRFAGAIDPDFSGLDIYVAL
jgi:Ca2+-binding RTX toxin-like protein